MKKLIALMVVTLMTVMAFAAPVSAASAESDITAALKSAGVAQTYISQAESYMGQAGVDLSEAQITGIVQDINDAVAIAAGEKDYGKLTVDQKVKIAAEIAHAASLLGLTTRLDKDGLSIIDPSGKVLITVSTETVKKTGADYSMVFIGLAVLAAAAVSPVVVKKLVKKQKKEYDVV